MTLTDEVINLFARHSIEELIFMFWPFFFFDLPRFVLLDIICVPFFWFQRWRDRNRVKNAKLTLFREYPIVTVIAPGKNEGKHLPALIESIKQQSYKNIEIILVDDGSDDDTLQILRVLKKEGLIDNYFRNERRGGKASAANLSLRFSQGKFVVHLDADTHLREDAIENVIFPFYMQKGVGAVGGDIRVKNIDYNLLTRLQALEYIKTISMGRIVNSVLGILRIISGAFGAFRSDILLKIKGWDVGPGLDGDIVMRMRKMRFKVLHEPTAIAYTSVPISIKALMKQRYRWSRSLVRFRLRRHRDMLSPFNKNFELFNALTVVDNIFFNFILDFKWIIYIFQILFFDQTVIFSIIIVNYLLYFAINMIEYFMARLSLGHTFNRNEKYLWLFLPLMPFYTGFFLRAVRTFSYIAELFFKASFYDRWNPWKVSKIVKDEY
ncbi:glycosyltransferase family 2 protein [Nitratifractor sp.]